jgi:hypothetical protein
MFWALVWLPEGELDRFGENSRGHRRRDGTGKFQAEIAPFEKSGSRQNT